MKNLETLSNRKDITPVLLINGKLATKQEPRRVGIVAQPASVDPDPEYSAWKKSMGLDQPLSRSQYVSEYCIY